jgi:hypothetical protein
MKEHNNIQNISIVEGTEYKYRNIISSVPDHVYGKACQCSEPVDFINTNTIPLLAISEVIILKFVA